MFPLDFPYEIFKEAGKKGQWALDPFCGRGTTVYAGRMLGLRTIGIDSSPVAVAISQAKLANTNPRAIIREVKRILNNDSTNTHVPEGIFWEKAYHPDVLSALCKIREELLNDCESDERIALRAIVLGALHGPKQKTKQSYFSNQCQRTYAPKPVYAVNFWNKNRLEPDYVNILSIIEERANKYFNEEVVRSKGQIITGDSRDSNTFKTISKRVSWIITSPPYYGMRTYIPDQWLRLWFLGGQSTVDYSMNGQVEHASPEMFAAQLKKVWINSGAVAKKRAQMVIRFGGLNDRKADPLEILYHSLDDTGWKIDETKSAGFASQGNRQAVHINTDINSPREEYDVWATWRG
ncbi:DNA modification methylase [Fibrisoma montanum]|uniref:site-specific DNA-methyltransferase (cytosine-N(4)-specific) n=1 Tax=Fibrisoma montanum TaxID=2305895 RepID=A0A418LZ44_9BACT|nr:DNA methyltransferase [Fibrisoma montanum]RIV18550.1 DNA modification methylase [Fibrisoma montanum]